MATAPVRQSSFGRGEITPLAYGRTDHPVYASAAKRLTNLFATPHGAIKNRAGLKSVGQAIKDSNAHTVGIPFVFSATQSYVIELGNLYARFISGGAYVLTGLGAPYEIVTPFTTAMLDYLSFAQAGDIVTICYGGQEPGGTAAIVEQELRRLGHANWTIGAVSHTKITAIIGGFFLSGLAYNPDATHPAKPWKWRGTITYQDANGNVLETAPLELIPGNYNPATNYAQGAVQRYNGTDYTSLQNANLGNQPDISPAWWAAGIVVHRDAPRRITGNLSAFEGANPGLTAVTVDIARGKTGVFGSVGTAEVDRSGGTPIIDFLDEGDSPDFSEQPPKQTDPFALLPAGHDYPSCVTFFEQRRVFGRQGLHPRKLQGSRPGKHSNFDVDIIVEDDDAISFDLDSSAFDEIRHLFHLGTMVALTQSGVWKIRGFQGEALSSTSVDSKRDAKVGCSWVKPALAGDAILFVRERGSGISEAVFDGVSGKWVVNDLTVFGSHLFEGHTIVCIAFAEEPHKILWAVRDDGVILGLTRFSPDVLAWHRHTTDGSVEWVVVVPEGTEDAGYFLIKRTINGVTRRAWERMASRLVTDIRTACFLDGAVAFDGRNTGGTTMKFTSDGATYLGGEEGTILASVASFNTVDESDKGDQIVLDPDGTQGGPFRLTILSVTDATHARAQLDTKDLAAALQNVATTSWGWARDSFAGLDHLEAKSVMVLGDGNVQGPFVVAGGVIQGLAPAVLGTIGLAYTSILDPLDLAQEKGKQKIVKAVAFELIESRGGWVGETEADADLKEWDDQRTTEDAFAIPPLFTGRATVTIESVADTRGRAVFVQKDPLPCTIVGITRYVEVGGDTGAQSR